MQPETLFYCIVLIYSIILHEIAHGFAAYLFGDKTALYAGRLTLNPLPHIDPVGSLLLPVLLIFSGSSLLFGWAKPVPVNEYNLSPVKKGLFWVAIAGVLTNFVLGISFMLLGSLVASATLKGLFLIISITNFALCFFNLIPFPPADGYRILSIFLPPSLNYTINRWINQYTTAFLIGSIILASFVFKLFFPLVYTTVRSFVF